jgi:hypothetical protein
MYTLKSSSLSVTQTREAGAIREKENKQNSPAQRRGLQEAINNSPRQLAQRQTVWALQSNQAVIQAKWELDEVLTLLLATESGRDALDRMQAHEVSILHQKENKYMSNVVGSKASGFVYDSKIKPTGTHMNGYGEASAIYVSDELSPEMAAALIVHESTHAAQSNPEGLVYEWNVNKGKYKDNPERKKALPTSSEMELAMEMQAHTNQFAFEIELQKLTGNSFELSKKASDSLTNGQVDEEKVKAILRGTYKIPDSSAKPAEPSVKEIDTKEFKAARKFMGIEFRAQSNAKAVYPWSHVKGLVERKLQEK